MDSFFKKLCVLAILVLAGFAAFGFYISGQKQSQPISQTQTSFAVVLVPDYLKWTYGGPSKVNVLLNGKEVSLSVNEYFSLVKVDPRDDIEMVSILSNTDGNEWILIHVIESIATGKSVLKFHFFEMKNGKWEFVRSFSGGDDNPDFMYSFLKEKYGLESPPLKLE